MASKTFCDRASCGKEIESVPFRLVLPAHVVLDLCEKCEEAFYAWVGAKEVDEFKGHTGGIINRG